MITTLYAFTALIAVYFAYLISRYRNTTLSYSLLLMSLGIVIWSFSEGIQLITSIPSIYRILDSIKFMGISLLICSWVYYCYFVSGHISKVKLLWIYIHTVIGFTMALLVATNDYHLLVWNQNNILFHSSRQPVYWMYVSYCYMLYLTGLMFLLEKYVSVHSVQKNRLFVSIIAGFFPVFASIIYFLKIIPAIYNDPIIPSLLPTLFIAYYAVAKCKILDVQFVSNTHILNCITDGIMVIDHQNIILSVNRSISTLFPHISESSIGAKADTVMKSWLAVQNICSPGQEHILFLDIKNHHNQSLKLEVRSIPLLQHHFVYGYILILKDITQLHEAYIKIENLAKLVPICSSCKSIRDDEGYWNSIESYLSKDSSKEISHGICEECIHHLYPEYAKEFGT